jgi:hypothetical protein
VQVSAGALNDLKRQDMAKLLATHFVSDEGDAALCSPQARARDHSLVGEKIPDALARMVRCRHADPARPGGSDEQSEQWALFRMLFGL